MRRTTCDTRYEVCFSRAGSTTTFFVLLRFVVSFPFPSCDREAAMPLKMQDLEEPQLNLTPMIDVVFNLIIFFMWERVSPTWSGSSTCNFRRWPTLNR